LVIIGVNERGEKHFLAIEDGVRESTQSWREVLLARMFHPFFNLLPNANGLCRDGMRRNKTPNMAVFLTFQAHFPLPHCLSACRGSTQPG
jgi:hypothetical protein